MRPKDAPLEGSPGREIVLRAGRAERHHLAKEFDAASVGYSTLVQEAPTFPNVHYAYGRFLVATGDLDRGVAQFLEEINNSPNHVRARMQIAAARYRVDSAAGIPFAAEVVKLEPGYPFGHYLLGLLYFDVGDIGRAIPELEAAARMVPQEAQFQFTLGNAYARAGRKEDGGARTSGVRPPARQRRATRTHGRISTSTRSRCRGIVTARARLLARRRTSGLSLSFVECLSGGASRLAALLVARNIPIYAARSSRLATRAPRSDSHSTHDEGAASG